MQTDQPCEVCGTIKQVFQIKFDEVYRAWQKDPSPANFAKLSTCPKCYAKKVRSARKRDLSPPKSLKPLASPSDGASQPAVPQNLP